MSEFTEAEAVARLAESAVEPNEIEPGEVYTAADGNGGVRVFTTDEFAEHPRHTAAARSVTDAGSFVGYVNRHKLSGTEVYAHTLTSSVVAVIDSHEGAVGAPGWQKHRVSLVLEHSKSWLAWSGHDLGADVRAWFGQQEFAEFIEANALDVKSPAHATVIELATKFEATKSVDFGQATRSDNGEIKFEYTETIGARKGTKGDIAFPKELELALRPYVGGPIYKVTASLRYRIAQDGLRLGYALVRPEAILEAAFTDIVNEIRDGRHDKGEWPEHDGIGDVPIFAGRP